MFVCPEVGLGLGCSLAACVVLMAGLPLVVASTWQQLVQCWLLGGVGMKLGGKGVRTR